MKMNAAEALEAQLRKAAKQAGGDLDALARKIGTVAVGTATDPYQPAEGKAQLTRACLEVLAKYRIVTTITTRSPLILRDLDILAKLPVASVNISINTLDHDLTRQLEPAAPHPLKRLETVRELAQHGIPAGIFMAPILPYLTDSRADLEALIQAAADHRAGFAMASALRLSPDVKAWYLQVLQEHYPHLVPAYCKLYSGTYADKRYTDSLSAAVNELLRRHGLSADTPRGPSAADCPASSLAGSHGAGANRGAASAPQPEQLSFPF